MVSEKTLLKKKLILLEEELNKESFKGKDMLEVFFGSFLVSLLIVLQDGFTNVVRELTLAKLFLIIILTILILSYKIKILGLNRLSSKDRKKHKFYFIERLIMIYSITLITSFLVLLIFSVTNNILWGTFLLALPASMAAALLDLLTK